MKLSSIQQEAIKHGDGPAIVIAGPGSGKTAVLIRRIYYLINHHNINPENILVITFSKAASNEMQNRFFNLCNNSFYPVTFGTFHSVFFNIVKDYYHFSTSNIITISQKRSMMKNALINNGIIDYPENDLIDSLLKEVAFYKNTNEKRLLNSETNINPNDFIRIYKTYRKYQIADKKIDFEDMMLIVRNLFNERSDILQMYREKYKYILIDEYQDINDIQYEIIKMLTIFPEKNYFGNIWVCGDLDQSIYGFRSSNPMIMLNFNEDYKGALRYELTTNYRCGKAIIDGAAKVISQNTNRFDIEIKPGNLSMDSKLDLLGFINEEEEKGWIVSTVQRELANNSALSIALFVRTNREVSKYAELLKANNIECNITEALYNPYATDTYRIFSHYIHLAMENDKHDIDHLLPVINRPSRYVKKEYINSKYVSIKDLIEKYEGNMNMINVLRTFEYQINKLKTMDLYSQIIYIRKCIGLDEYMKKHYSSKDKFDEYMENADWILSNSRRFESISKMDEYAENYINSIKEKKAQSNKNVQINIMTFHASKGLEFDTVFIPHLNEGYVPHKKAHKMENIEEERRLFYVAMTRAKRNLYLSYVKGDEKNRYMPSRFLYVLF